MNLFLVFYKATAYVHLLFLALVNHLNLLSVHIFSRQTVEVH